MFGMLRAGYNTVLSAFSTGDSVPLQAEKDGTLRAGLRPRGYATANQLYQGGVLITADGNITMTGEDAVSSGSIAVVKGMTIPGPLTVTAATATFLGYK
jgi:hypothetical protein